MKEVQEQLRKQGVSSVLLTDAKPGIQEFLELSDPDGNVIHLFNEMEQPAIGFGTSGIVPLKLGHIGFHSNNFRKTVDFYTDVLGFTVTDKIGADLCNFLTCNNDHHVLNIVGADRPNKMHHIAFQLKDASHQNISSDILARHGIDVLWGPTRHTSGHNIATYHYDADENLVELFIDLDVYIPELGIFEPRPWHKELPMKPKVWDALSSWGTDFAFDLANLK
ncbi:catechol 2,3-dioxygenase-like lactoylglutathione lyase family enzyme [Paenibacillus sp. V4I3]|uniref:VOC family protein n=1 Tax=unclassified Paenibacillus TaxID=185978 RepID=UPI00278ACC26|nr:MULTISPECIES: VOC family protein [unclassified Paenibacillus]MDQ0874476.1 catechol 2,3-dioxygenase-like lactoylglutathione lyase family enzyme [Paenibacillus sp. V4I3]MDQ0889766.1 catechol 2,3-dioxygenase-like lactoylglutathione lyase family enzyme [Paenibacillus sp. V4I9]